MSLINSGEAPPHLPHLQSRHCLFPISLSADAFVCGSRFHNSTRSAVAEKKKWFVHSVLDCRPAELGVLASGPGLEDSTMSVGPRALHGTSTESKILSLTTSDDRCIIIIIVILYWVFLLTLFLSLPPKIRTDSSGSPSRGTSTIIGWRGEKKPPDEIGFEMFAHGMFSELKIARWFIKNSRGIILFSRFN